MLRKLLSSFSLFLSVILRIQFILKVEQRIYSNQYYWFESRTWKNLHVVYLCQVYLNGWMIEFQCSFKRIDDCSVLSCWLAFDWLEKKTCHCIMDSKWNACAKRTERIMNLGIVNILNISEKFFLLSFILNFVFQERHVSIHSKKSFIFKPQYWYFTYFFLFKL